jgi:hypothetical protein
MYEIVKYIYNCNKYCLTKTYTYTIEILYFTGAATMLRTFIRAKTK